FLQPPEVRVNGQAPFRDIEGPADVDDANLKFDIVRGAPFQCLKFQAQNVMGVVWWRARQVLLTNVQARAYGGNMAGWAAFDFDVPHEPVRDCRLSVAVTNLDVPRLAADLRNVPAIRPLLPIVTTDNPVAVSRMKRVNAILRGSLRLNPNIQAQGSVAVGPFAVRDQPVDHFAADFSFTNRVLAFSGPRLRRGTETMTASNIIVDLNRRVIRFINGCSTADPESVARAIGPETGKLMEPYHFLQPPEVRVNGQAPFRDINGPADVDDANLKFDIVRGAPFQCLKFQAQSVMGVVWWRAQQVLLTNVQARAYGGNLAGWAAFDFGVPHDGADYRFNATAQNLDLAALARGLTGRSTRLKGEVRGSVAVTRGDTRNWRGMIGSGNVHVQNGFLWDIPLFGVFSPLLDQISPGLGSIEASDAGGNFRVGGGGVSSDSFQFHSTLMRLDYSGGVTFDQTIHATVTAQLLRDMPGLGQFFSVVFWPVGKIFEYNVTGTLGHPNMQSVVPFLPGLLQFPLHPLRTLQNLVPQDPPPDAHKNSAR
ncbi:MAG: hypothetical protein KGR98_11540, partial [Verrucomicrobia bacterium]|nr:hypothetical protein [Verrucomicrobiota bacterium]